MSSGIVLQTNGLDNSHVDLCHLSQSQFVLSPSYLADLKENGMRSETVVQTNDLDNRRGVSVISPKRNMA